MTTAKGSRGLESGGVEAGPRAKRRSWSTAERQRIVEAALAPGASVAGVARAHEVNANLVLNGSVGRGKAGAIAAVHCGGRPGPTRPRRSSPFVLLRRRRGMRSPGRAARRAGGVIRRAPRGSGRWRFAFPTAGKFASKAAPTARSCVSCFRR